MVKKSPHIFSRQLLLCNWNHKLNFFENQAYNPGAKKDYMNSSLLRKCKLEVLIRNKQAFQLASANGTSPKFIRCF